MHLGLSSQSGLIPSNYLVQLLKDGSQIILTGMLMVCILVFLSTITKTKVFIVNLIYCIVGISWGKFFDNSIQYPMIVSET